MTTPYVDPKGHVVPMVSVTNDDLPTIQTEDVSDDHELPEPAFRLSAVPNFSRQLPLRLSQSNDESASSGTEERHLAPLRPSGFEFEPLRSPAVASFNIPSFTPYESSDSEVMSPIKTSFDNPWPTGYDLDSQPQASVHEELDRDSKERFFAPLSPRATSFELGQPAPSQASHHDDRHEVPKVTSPLASDFPKDVFGNTDASLEDELKSPRATEFHMTPLKPRMADEDPFGLTSPTRADFNPFDRPSIAAIKDSEVEDRRPSFQAILPPAHQTFNGFASLDGTAQTNAIFEPPSFMSMSPPKLSQAAGPRFDSLSNSPENQASAPIDSAAPVPVAFPKAPDTPRSPSETFLSTPAKAIRTRFSSPNMREQRKLHKLQTEIQSKLPKPPAPQHAADDIDAIMSPRAEEFTRNPFHYDIQSSGDDASPVSSNETIKDGRNGHVAWEEPLPRQWTPEKAAVDPRSPVQTGSNPIVRNIWDVL
jgi:tyrosine-protein phosphatase